MAAASRTVLAPQHVAGFKARHLEGLKALSLQMRERCLKVKLPKPFGTNKASAEEGKNHLIGVSNI